MWLQKCCDGNPDFFSLTFQSPITSNFLLPRYILLIPNNPKLQALSSKFYFLNLPLYEKLFHP